MPVRIGILFVTTLLVIVFNQLPQPWRDPLLSTQATVAVLGFGLFVCGMALAIYARIFLGSEWGMPMTERPVQKLVTTGPYRYIRHPIYSGFLLMALGSAIDVNAYWLLISIAAACYFAVSAVVEENTFAKQHPTQYSRYKSKTKMFIPFIL